MLPPRQINRIAILIVLLLVATIQFHWWSGEDLAFAHLYYGTIVLAGFAFRVWWALLFALVASLASGIIATLVSDGSPYPFHAYVTVSRTLGYCLTAVTTSSLATALRWHVNKLLALHEITASMNSTLKLSETLELVVRHCAALTNVPVSFLFLSDSDKGMMTVAAAFGASTDEHKNIELSTSDTLVGTWMSEKKAIVINDLRQLPEGKIPTFITKSGRSLMCAPLIVRDRPIGIIVVISRVQRRFTQANLDILRLLANAAAIAIVDAQLYERAAQLAITDGLTELYNQRYFMQHLDLEIRRAQRRPGSVSLIIFDLDRFKAVNDTHGHMTGDKVLREVAQAAKRTIRGTDILGRIGGEEFAIILPETSREAAVAVAEKLREEVSRCKFESTGHQSIRITISAGVSCYPDDGSTEEQIYEAADKAMYRAKAEGRNRVIPGPGKESVLTTVP